MKDKIKKTVLSQTKKVAESSKSKLLNGNSTFSKRLKRAEKISKLGAIGGIKGRIIAFLIAFLVPIFFSLFVLFASVIIMSGIASYIIVHDAELAGKVNDFKGNNKGSDSNGGRLANIPEHLKGKLLYPAGTKISSHYYLRDLDGPGGKPAKWHRAIDLAGNGNPSGGTNYIYPMYPGIISKVGENFTADGGFGYYTIIKHDIDGTVMYSLYAHMKGNLTQQGQSVDYTTPVGIMDGTGYTGGKKYPIHLHFELHDSTFVYGGTEVRGKSALKPTEYLYCASKKVENTHPQMVDDCTKYRFEQVH